MANILRHLLVATDDSADGDRVVTFAIALAREHASSITFAHVGERHEPASRYEDASDSVLLGARNRAIDAGLDVKTIHLSGRPAHAIVTFAHELAVDAIVIGVHARISVERIFTAGTVDGVMRTTDIPTIVLPAHFKDGHYGIARILVAIDDSDPSDAAGAFAIALAECDRSAVVFCTVVETGHLLKNAVVHGFDPIVMLRDGRSVAMTLLAQHIEHAEAAGVTSTMVVLEDDPVERILALADTDRVDAIVVGTHGRRGLRRLFLGSVAEQIVRRSTVPVAVVRA